MDNEQPDSFERDPSEASTKRTESSASATAENASPNSSAPIPEASFESLVTLLATQAMSCLGQIPEVAADEPLNKPLARHYIDTLSMLAEKTEGNLSDFEEEMLTQTLHTLRMMYLHSN